MILQQIFTVHISVHQFIPNIWSSAYANKQHKLPYGLVNEVAHEERLRWTGLNGTFNWLMFQRAGRRGGERICHHGSGAVNGSHPLMLPTH